MEPATLIVRTKQRSARLLSWMAQLLALESRQFQERGAPTTDTSTTVGIKHKQNDRQHNAAAVHDNSDEGHNRTTDLIESIAQILVGKRST